MVSFLEDEAVTTVDSSEELTEDEDEEVEEKEEEAKEKLAEALNALRSYKKAKARAY